MDTFSVLDDHLDPETEMAAWFCSGMSRSEVGAMPQSQDQPHTSIDSYLPNTQYPGV